MEKFTKASWIFSHSEYPDGSWNGDYEITAGGNFIAGVSRSDVVNEADANAALIAAAPEMYEMLKAQCRMMHKIGFTDERDAIQQLLAKARGEK